MIIEPGVCVYPYIVLDGKNGMRSVIAWSRTDAASWGRSMATKQVEDDDDGLNDNDIALPPPSSQAPFTSRPMAPRPPEAKRCL